MLRARFFLALLPFAVGTACGQEGTEVAPGNDGGADGTVGPVEGGAPQPDGGPTPDAGSSSGGHDGAADGDAASADGARPEAGGDGGQDGGAPFVGASVLEYHSHNNRDGYFRDPLLTRSAAAAFELDTSFVATYPDRVWASPLYVDGGNGKGTFFVATSGNNLYAFDETGAPAWPVKNFGTPADHTGAGCGNVQPIGITGTPAIDLVTGLIVFDAVTGDATGAIATHTIYGVSIADGSTRWSVDVSTLKDASGLAFSPQPQNQRGGVLIVNGVAYVVYGGNAGDCGVYHGWVVGVPLTGKGARAWATPVQGAGIWAPGGAASDGQSIFVATGNGINGSATMWQGSEGILRLDPGPSFTSQPADYFAPGGWYVMDQVDQDLGGSGPLVIDAPSLTPSKLVMAQSKDGWVYLMDRGNLGGVATTNTSANVGALPVSTGPIANGSAWATVGGTTYVVLRPNGTEPGFQCPGGTSGDLVAVKLDPTAPQKMVTAWCADSGGNGSPIITSSDGTNDALVWVFGAEVESTLHSFDLADGSPVGTSAPIPLKSGQYARHFATIAAVKGRIFVAADGGLYAFKGP